MEVTEESWTKITMDASKRGWGLLPGLLHSKMVGVSCEIGMVSNVLEVWAAHFALTTHDSRVEEKSVLLQMDNKAAVVYIQKQGGTHCNTLLRKVEPIMAWAELHLRDLRAIY